MKINKIYITVVAALAVACNQVNIDPELQYGEISVSLGEPDVEVVTRAGALLPTDADAANYTVRILNESGQLSKDFEGNDCIGTYNNFSTRKLPLGKYYVTAENCSEDDAEAGSGKKRIAGKSPVVELSASALSKTAAVNCEVTNALVSVKFDDSVKGRFTELKVRLAGGTTGRNINVSLADGNKEIWFNPSTVNYSITGKFNAGGVVNDNVSITGTLILAAKDNKAIVVKVNLDNGQLVPAITIDASIADPVEVPGEFNPYL